jgi:hypothetical protein
MPFLEDGSLDQELMFPDSIRAHRAQVRAHATATR